MTPRQTTSYTLPVSSKGPTTGKQSNRVYEYAESRFLELAKPIRRPPWESSDWWVIRANRYSPRDCGKNETHGPARLRYQTGFTGRSLGWSCRVCGWDYPVLVQEGSHEPCAPDRSGNVPREKWSRTGGQTMMAGERAPKAKDRFAAGVLEAAEKLIDRMIEEGDGSVVLATLGMRAKAEGIPRRAIERAKQEMGLNYRKNGFAWEAYK